MGSFNRNDITIAVDTKGNVWAAQGETAWEDLQDKGIAEAEHGLYYSQLPHRAAWRDEDGNLTVGLPSQAPSGALVFGRLHGMTGTPCFVGQV
jgi:hypothetical protein